jgi:GH35 family endo-1,4-beta-xylanase
VRHAFLFGTAAPASRVLDEQDPRFIETLAEQFNVVTLENDLLWPALAGDWGPEFTLDRVQKAIDVLTARGIVTRGHVLVSPSWRHLPRGLQQQASDAAKVGAEVRGHVKELVTALRGKIAQWDVVDEPYDNHELLDLLGEQAMVEWFETARAADPDANLFIDDYGILTGGGSPIHRDRYAKTIQMLIDAGAPLDGVGMQGHFGSTLTPPNDLIDTLDRFARLGKPILITQFDVPALDEKLAAAYTRDFYTAAFSHPAVQGVVMWGFWDGSHWKNNAPLYRKDWSLKPAGAAYRQLVLTDWNTDVKAQTGADGALKARGFLGEYVVTASHGGKQGEARATLVREGSRVVVKL